MRRSPAALAAAAALGALFLWWLVLPTNLVGTAIVEIPPGMSVRQISALLSREGVVRSGLVFHVLARLSGRPLQAGEYGFRRTTPWGALRMIQDGRVYLHRILVREGDAVDQVAESLGAEKVATPDGFRRAAGDSRVLAAAGIKAGSAEGYCFPDTYFFPKGTPPALVVARMAERFRQRVPEGLAAEASAQGLNARQWVILASIVEKEARVPEERPVIAGVYLNRLRKGMRLEADPTVVFVLKHWDKPISLYDIRTTVSPYNTYKRAGLPPGPICNPGLKSLEAAARPAKVPYLFFVARMDGTGRHEFTRTLAEHERAIANARKRKVKSQ